MKYLLLFGLLTNGFVQAQSFASFKPLKLPYETKMSDEAYQTLLFDLDDTPLPERAILREWDLEELKNSEILDEYGLYSLGRIDMANHSVFVVFSIQWRNEVPDEPLDRSLSLIVLKRNSTEYTGEMYAAYWMQSDGYFDGEYDENGDPIAQEEQEEPELDYMDCKIYLNADKQLMVETANWTVRLEANGTFQEVK